MENDAQACVLSDVHMDAPPLQEGSTWMTSFTLPETCQAPSSDTAEALVDEDGDLLIDRQTGMISKVLLLINACWAFVIS